MNRKPYDYPLLKTIIAEILPHNNTLWNMVADAYYVQSKEPSRRNPSMIRRYWKKHGSILFIPRYADVHIKVPGTRIRKSINFEGNEKVAVAFVIAQSSGEFRNGSRQTTSFQMNMHNY